MYDHSDAQGVRPLRLARDGEERAGGADRREHEAHGLRRAEEPAEGVSLQGVIWRWHRRRRREQ